MSKSKRNIVDPDDIIETYGADTARWFMLSDSPPERDVIWTEEGVAGRVALRPAPLAPGERGGRRRGWRRQGPAGAFSARRASRLRKAAHGALARVAEDIEKLRFNRCVAHIYELANALQAALADAGGKAVAPDLAWAVREAVEILVQLIAPMMPHLAEECWAALGHRSLVAEQAWPVVEPGSWSRARSRCRCRSTARSGRM